MKNSNIQTTHPAAIIKGWARGLSATGPADAAALNWIAITPTQLAANTDNWNPTDLATASIIRASTDASRNLTGIVAPSPADEKLLILENVGSFDLVVKHDVTSTAANRFYCPDNSDLTVKRNTAVALLYDTTSSRWRVIQSPVDLAGHLTDTVDAHDASAVSYDNSGSGMTATDVQDAIDELDGTAGGHVTFTLGPFFINDLPGTATTQATLIYYNTATASAINASTNDPLFGSPGKVIGAIINSDAARSTGTATVEVRIAGSATTFDSGSVQLNGTNTIRDSGFVVHASGVAWTSNQSVGAAVTTSGWAPTTANIVVFLVLSLD